MAARKSHNQTNLYVIESESNESEQIQSTKVTQQMKTGSAATENEQNQQELLSQSEVIERDPDSLDNLSPGKDNKSQNSNNKEESKTQKDEQFEFEGMQKKPLKKVPKKDGSLLGLFSSEFFSIHMLFTHLYKAAAEGKEGVIDHLINKLYTEPIVYIDFYLPQLCYMILTTTGGTQRIEKFILETAVKQRNIALKALQLFQSFSEDLGSDYLDKAMDFYNTLEQTLVNGDIPLRYVQNRTNPLKRFEDYCDKKHKADYLNLQIKFLDKLKCLSIKLKTLSLADRGLYLQKRLEEVNQWMEKEVRSQVDTITTQSKFNFFGVVMPLHEGDDDDPILIMNIVPTLAIPFDTKKRAPFRVAFETVRLSELIKIKQTKSEKQSQDDKEEREYQIQKQQQEAELFEDNNHLSQLGFTQEDLGDIDNPFNYINQKEEEEKGIELTTKPKKEAELNLFAIQQDISFKGFDNFVKFVAFEENNLFDFQNTTNKLFADNAPLKTAQSMMIPKDQVEDADDNEDAQSSKSQKNNAQQEKEFKKLQEQLQPVKQDSVKADLSDPHQVDEIIEKFASRKSSNLAKHQTQNDQQSYLFDSVSRSSSMVWDEWENVSESDINLEGMDDPFKEKWRKIEKKHYMKSNIKEYKSYQLRPFIVKANDDLRQEVLSMQLMKRMVQIFQKANLNIYLRPYEIFITSSNSGMIEFIPDTVSIDSLKKKFPKRTKTPWTLRTFFEKYYVQNFEEAQKNFVESLAGYSLYNYIFNVKDRHNANIMLDSQGHLVHIDFGFMLQSSPGGISFEGAPFKLTQEYIDVMDGVDSEIFSYFKSLLIKGFLEIRKNIDDILILIEILMKDSKMPCFVKPKLLFTEIRDRISLKYNTGQGVADSDYFELVDRIVKNSANNWRTMQYDSFQKMTNGIEKQTPCVYAF